jgi:hypothetical protein
MVVTEGRRVGRAAATGREEKDEKKEEKGTADARRADDAGTKPLPVQQDIITKQRQHQQQGQCTRKMLLSPKGPL